MMVAIIPLLILVALLVGLVLGLIMWLTNGSKRGHGEMACGGCGYAVRGLEALSCPECGADLRMVGINRGQSAGSRGAGIALTIICGGLLLLSCLVSGFWFVADSSPSSIQSGPLKAYPTQPSTPSMPTDGVSSEEDEEADLAEEVVPNDPEPTP